MRVSFFKTTKIRNIVFGFAAIFGLFAIAACSTASETDTETTAGEVQTSQTQDTQQAEPSEGEGATQEPQETDTSAGGSESSEATAGAESASASTSDNPKPDVDDKYLGDVDELETIDLVVGEGDPVESGSTLAMHYVGVLASDGTEFDNSYDRGELFSFDIGQGHVIAGWDEGIIGMKPGGRRVLRIPSEKAYGAQDRGPVIKANSDLIFIVDLVSVIKKPVIDAKYLGDVDKLETIDLVEGVGTAAKAEDIARVQYLIVDTEGNEIASSWDRGAMPFGFAIGRSPLPEGWTEGAKGMKVGGQRIIRVPEEQAFDDGAVIIELHLVELLDAPSVHEHLHTGTPSEEIAVKELTKGQGRESKAGDNLEVNFVLMSYASGEIMQSTFIDGATSNIALTEKGESHNPLNDSLIGIKAGEVREVIVPAKVYFGGTVPPEADIKENDALIFIIEVVSIG